MARPKYRRPPIEEAVCQLHFAPSQEWGLTLLAHLHLRLKDAYPEPPREQQILESELSGGREEGKLGFFLKTQIAKSRIQFPAENGTRLVSVGPDELGVHVLRPYAGWDQFRPRIVDALAAYREVATPVGVSRIGLRYINRIPLPPGEVQLGRYFTKFPDYPDGIPVSRMVAFFSRIECEFPDQPIRLSVTFADIETKPEEPPSVLLDIDAAWLRKNDALPVDRAMEQIDDLKERVSLTFEQYITDELRAAINGD